MKIEFKTNLFNSYGTVGFRNDNGKYYMFLDNWDGENSIEISKKLFKEAMDLFTKPPTKP
jgi:hypothetical protein